MTIFFSTSKRLSPVQYTSHDFRLKMPWCPSKRAFEPLKDMLSHPWKAFFCIPRGMPPASKTNAPSHQEQCSRPSRAMLQYFKSNAPDLPELCSRPSRAMLQLCRMHVFVAECTLHFERAKRIERVKPLELWRPFEYRRPFCVGLVYDQCMFYVCWKLQEPPCLIGIQTNFVYV